MTRESSLPNFDPTSLYEVVHPRAESGTDGLGRYDHHNRRFIPALSPDGGGDTGLYYVGDGGLYEKATKPHNPGEYAPYPPGGSTLGFGLDNSSSRRPESYGRDFPLQEELRNGEQ